MSSLFIGGPADGLRKKPTDRRVVEIAYSDELGRPEACIYYEHTYVVWDGDHVRRYSIMTPNVKEGNEHELVIALSDKNKKLAAIRIEGIELIIEYRGQK